MLAMELERYTPGSLREGDMRTVHRFPRLIVPISFQKRKETTLAMEVERSTPRFTDNLLKNSRGSQ